MEVNRTQVAIIGAGPSGLLTGQLLHQHGIKSVILERKSREHVEARIRAGLLEHTTVDLVREAKASERMDREGVPHHGISIVRQNGEVVRLDFREHTEVGDSMLIYGQQELTKDLIKARLETAQELKFDCPVLAIENFSSGTAPCVIYEEDGKKKRLDCDFVLGCDGYHGIARKSLPADKVTAHEKVYPFSWLGLLADTPPVSTEVTYVTHERGFALCSMRSLTRSRMYIQIDANDRLEDWTPEAFREELRRRLPPHLAEKVVDGPVLEMSIAPIRSMVTEPMSLGRLFLAGDAAHIVPPAGAKGLNLAASDVMYLTKALIAYYKEGRSDLLAAYSDKCLARVWDVVRFCWWFVDVTHNNASGGGGMDFNSQVSEMDLLHSSLEKKKEVAENIVGIPHTPFE